MDAVMAKACLLRSLFGHLLGGYFCAFRLSKKECNRNQKANGGALKIQNPFAATFFAIANPIPCEPPVTTIVSPARFCISISLPILTHKPFDRFLFSLCNSNIYNKMRCTWAVSFNSCSIHNLGNSSHFCCHRFNFTI